MLTRQLLNLLRQLAPDVLGYSISIDDGGRDSRAFVEEQLAVSRIIQQTGPRPIHIVRQHQS